MFECFAFTLIFLAHNCTAQSLSKPGPVTARPSLPPPHVSICFPCLCLFISTLHLAHVRSHKLKYSSIQMNMSVINAGASPPRQLVISCFELRWKKYTAFFVYTTFSFNCENYCFNHVHLFSCACGMHLNH